MNPENLNKEEIQLLIDFLESCAYAGGKFELRNEIDISAKARDILEQIES